MKISQRINKYFNTAWIAILFITVFLSSCGYQLRGYNSNNLLSIKSVFLDYSNITLSNANDKFIHKLADNLRSRDIKVITSKTGTITQSNNTIKILSSNYSKNTISSGSNKIIAQYKLLFNTSFSYIKNNKIVIKQQNISSERNYNFSENQILGIDDEEQTILNDILQEVSNRIISQISIVNTN